MAEWGPGSRLAVGSLPFLDPASAVLAQVRAFPEIPAWPQLPKRSLKEGMTRQGLGGLPGLAWTGAGTPFCTLSRQDFGEALETLRSEDQEGRLERAAFRPEEAAGYFEFLDSPGVLSGAAAVKGQAAGPVTLGLVLRDENDNPLLASPDAMELLAQYLSMHYRWQCRGLARLGKPVVFFIDEPVLDGRFVPEDFGWRDRDIQGWLGPILGRLQEEDVLTGLHSCGEGIWQGTWGLPMEILHFDGFRYGETLLGDPGALGGFLDQGGLLGWGLVPTAMTRGVFPDAAELFQRWEDVCGGLAKRGLDLELLAQRTLFSTSCGMGQGPVSVMEEGGRCLDMLSSLWKAGRTLPPHGPGGQGA